MIDECSKTQNISLKLELRLISSNPDAVLNNSSLQCLLEHQAEKAMLFDLTPIFSRILNQSLSL